MRCANWGQPRDVHAWVSRAGGQPWITGCSSGLLQEAPPGLPGLLQATAAKASTHHPAWPPVRRARSEPKRSTAAKQAQHARGTSRPRAVRPGPHLSENGDLSSQSSADTTCRERSWRFWSPYSLWPADALRVGCLEFLLDQLLDLALQLGVSRIAQPLGEPGDRRGIHI